MLNKIINFSLHNKLFVMLGVVLLVLGGYYSMRHLDIDVFPDLTAPTVVVMTDAENMATEEVERLVTFPIETAVNGATDVRRVRSSSRPGASFVWVEFDWGTDIYRARQIVSEKMVTLEGSLPEGITPVLAPQTSVMGEILFVGVEADSTDIMELRTLADWVIKPAILATGGVSQVTVMGGDYKQYQVLADPVAMNAYGVSLQELAEVVSGISENSTGGVVREYGNEFAIRGMARTTDLEELGNSLVKLNEQGFPITINDVAKVVIAPAVKMGYASTNAHPSILMTISKQPNVNTLEVTEDILATLESLKGNLPPDVVLDTDIFRQSDFIEASVNNVGRSLVEGAIFVIIILFVFLGSFRTTLISVVAIPLSLLGTVIVLYLFGQNINTMTLGGMCIAIGSLVDDAIIDVENVYKKLRKNRLLPKEQREPVTKVVFEGSTEIRASILNATFIIIVAFSPLFFLSGMEGRMLKPLGLAYIISLLMSLLVAMTVTPLLCKMMLGNENYLARNEKESWLSRKLSASYRHGLAWALGHKRIVVGTAAAALVAAIAVYFTLGHSFLPNFNEGSLTISAVSRPGLSLDLSNQIGNTIERQLLSIDEVVSTSRRTGRGELDEHSQATNSAEIEVKFNLKDRSKDEFLEEVRAKLAEVPGVVTSVGQPLSHRIDHILSGTQAGIAIKIFGPDLSRLFMLGNQIKDQIQGIEGVVDLNVEQQTETPQLQIRANRPMLARYGITIDQFNRFIELSFPGTKLGEVYEGQRSFDLVVRLQEPYTQTIEGLSSALITTGTGAKVPLSEVAEIVSTNGPNSVSRENVQRKLVVSCNVAGRDMESVVNEIRHTVAENVDLGEDYRVEYGGQFESAESASRTLALVFVAALFLIFCILYSEFRHVGLSLLILVNLPLALIGGVFAIRISSGIVSIPSIIGFITLFGIAIRNGILLVAEYERLGGGALNPRPSDSVQEMEEKRLRLREIITEGSIDRLNPILMTALTAALALIPLIMNGDKSGNEIQSPMGIVVLGGLITSTLLNVFVVPALYEWFRKRPRKKDVEAHEVEWDARYDDPQMLHPGMVRHEAQLRSSRSGSGSGLMKAVLPFCLFSLGLWAMPAQAQEFRAQEVPEQELQAEASTGKPYRGAALDIKETAANQDPTVLHAADYTEVLSAIDQYSPLLKASRQQMEADLRGNHTGNVPENPEFGFGYFWMIGNSAGQRVDFEASQSFDFPSVYVYKSRMAKSNDSAVYYRFANERAQIMLQAQNLCVELIYNNALMRILEQRLESARKVASSYQEQLAQGGTSILEANKAELNLLGVESEMAALQAEMDRLKSDLKRLTGGIEVNLSQARFPDVVLPESFELWFAGIMGTNPLMQQAMSESLAKEQNVKVNVSEALPKFSVGYKGEDVFNDGFNGIAVGMSIPLWENKNRVKQARLESEAAQNRVLDVQWQLKAQLETLYYKALRLQPVVNRYREALSALDNLPYIERALENGEFSLMDYLGELEYQFDMMEAYLQAERDLALSWSELRWVAGSL